MSERVARVDLGTGPITRIDHRLIPFRASRRWGRWRILRGATVFAEDGSVAWVCPPNYVALHLTGRDARAEVVVPVPEALVADATFPLWSWVLPRANRAHRAGRPVAPTARRWLPVAGAS